MSICLYINIYIYTYVYTYIYICKLVQHHAYTFCLSLSDMSAGILSRLLLLVRRGNFYFRIVR